MKQVFIVANWKSNKIKEEISSWGEEIIISDSSKTVIVCPSFIHIPLLADSAKGKFFLGAQDVSAFSQGSYTGAVNGMQLREYCQYVLIGHSERREYFHEDQILLEKKVEQAKNNGIEPIFCISELSQKIPSAVTFVAYEPIHAIGTGIPDSPENAEQIAMKLKEENGNRIVLYGGSVNAENVHSFTFQAHIDGVLVGKSSLLASEWNQIIENA